MKRQTVPLVIASSLVLLLGMTAYCGGGDEAGQDVVEQDTEKPQDTPVPQDLSLKDPGEKKDMTAPKDQGGADAPMKDSNPPGDPGPMDTPVKDTPPPSDPGSKDPGPPDIPTGPFTLTSTAFTEGQPIPNKYTCAGNDVSPPLAWSNPPDGTKSFALTCFDPDAPGGGWVHWGIHDVPATAAGLDEGQGPAGTQSVNNDFGVSGYKGPCPPRVHDAHDYVFTLYALSVDSIAPVDYADLEAKAKAASLGTVVLTGTFDQ